MNLNTEILKLMGTSIFVALILIYAVEAM